MFMVRHPACSYVTPLLSLGGATPGTILAHGRCNPYAVRRTSGPQYDAAYATLDSLLKSPGSFARGTSNVCLVGENPTRSVPVTYVGMRESMVLRLHPERDA